MSMINLLPDDYLERRMQRRSNIVCVILFVVVMAGVMSAAGICEQNTRETESIRDDVNSKYAQAAKLLVQMQQLEAKKHEGLRKAKATASLLERIPRSYMLGLIAQSLPEHTALTEILLKSKRKVVKQSKTPAQMGSKFSAAQRKMQSQKPIPLVMTMEVTGLAATDVLVGDFIKNLLQSPLLAAVNLDYSQEKKLHPKGKGKDKPEIRVREFKIILELKSDMDVIDLIDSKSADPAQVSKAFGGSKSIEDDKGEIDS